MALVPNSEVERSQRIRRAIESIQMGVKALLEILEEDGQCLETLLQARAFIYGSSLSQAELDVLTHLAQGKSHVEIAQARKRSQKTVEHQIAGALRKLDFGDRREFVGWMRGVWGDGLRDAGSDEGVQSQSRDTTK